MPKLSTVLPVALALASSAAAQTQTLPSASATDQITVTANRSQDATGSATKTTYFLDSIALHEYPAVTLDESLRQHAGFELFRRAPSRVANPTSEGISLRGLGSTAVSRTLVLEDGAPLNDPFGGWVHWSESPQQTISSATLVTGGGSDLYGSSALGGVIDLTPAAASPTRFDFSGRGGSQSTSDLSGLATGTTDYFNLLAAGESLRTGGYIVADPSIAGAVDVPANVTSQSYHTELGRRGFQSGRLFATANLLNETRINGTPIQTNATRLWRYLVGFDPHESPHVATRVRAFGSNEGYRQSFSIIGLGRNSETLSRLQRVRSQELGTSVDGTVRLRTVALVAGVDLRDIRAADDETPISKGQPNGLAAVTARQRFIGGFGEALGAYKHWSAAASLRADRASNLDIVQTANTTVSRPVDRTEIVLSPRVGVVRTIGSAGDLHASAFRAFRAPSMNELYRTGQVGSEITLANAALQSERATGWEVGTQLSSTRRLPAALHATWFWTEINRPVSAVLLSRTATTITNQRQNLGQIRSQGLELSGDLHPIAWLSVTAGYQYADATVTRFSAQPLLVGNWIPAVPRHSFTAQVRAGSERMGSLTLAVRNIGRVFDDASNNFPLSGFYVIDLSGRRALSRNLEASFLVQNLTNQRAQVARTPTLTLGSPLFAEAGLRLHFGKTNP